MSDMTIVLLASGRGTRFGSDTAIPKQFTPLAGKPLLMQSVATALSIVAAEDVILTCTPGMTDEYRALGLPAGVRLVDGGERRQDSVRNALARLEGRDGVVLIHDTARPLASAELFNRVATGAIKHGACIPVVPCADTVKQLDAGGRVLRTVDRSDLGFSQTPQGFGIALLAGALARIPVEQDYTDEAALCEMLGIPVFTVHGERRNMKLTYPDDLAIMTALL